MGSHAENQPYDLVIVGAGPAGLTASIYASRALLDAVVLEQTSPGGQVLQTTGIDNYPGVPATTGFDLMEAMERQARDLGATITSDLVSSITRSSDGLFQVQGAGECYPSRTVILATGAVPRKAGFIGEDSFTGHGVSYCGTCDAMFYRGKQVFVVGGGNTAASEALFLAKFASKVTMLVRKDHLRAQKNLLEQLEAQDNLEIRFNTELVALEGDDLPSAVVLKDTADGTEHTERFEEGSFGVFVFVGTRPATELVSGLVETSNTGAIITNERMETKTSGLFAAGDVREKPLRQIVTAAADGAVAASMAAVYLGQPLDR